MTLDELRHGAGAAPSFVHGDTAQSSERAGRGPLTTRPCVCMGNGFFPNRPNAGAQLAVFSKRQYLPRPERGGGQVLFFEGPWPGLLERLWLAAPVFSAMPMNGHSGDPPADTSNSERKGDGKKNAWLRA